MSGTLKGLTGVPHVSCRWSSLRGFATTEAETVSDTALPFVRGPTSFTPKKPASLSCAASLITPTSPMCLHMELTTSAAACSVTQYHSTVMQHHHQQTADHSLPQAQCALTACRLMVGHSIHISTNHNTHSLTQHQSIMHAWPPGLPCQHNSITVKTLHGNTAWVMPWFKPLCRRNCAQHDSITTCIPWQKHSSQLGVGAAMPMCAPCV